LAVFIVKNAAQRPISILPDDYTCSIHFLTFTYRQVTESCTSYSHGCSTCI